MPRLKGQHNQRRPEIWLDQHKRQYFINLDIISGDPIDINRRGWRAPRAPSWAKGLFMPPIGDKEVVKLVPQSQRHLKGYQLFIDYDAWLRKVDKAEETRRQRIASIAADLGSGKALELVANPTRDLEAYVGPPPMPPREIILAMRAGNRWALGLSDEMPEKARAIMDALKLRVAATRSVADPDEAIRDPFADEMLDASFDGLDEGTEHEDPLGDDAETLAIKAMYAAEQATQTATAVAEPLKRGGRKGVRA